MLAYEAAKRGYEAVVGPKAEIKQYARHQGSGIYLFKHWESVFPYPFDHENRNRYFYIGFHPEGLVFTEERFRNYMNVPGKSEKLDLNLVYGKVQRELLLDENPLLEGMVHEVGHPRFDLLRPEYHHIYQKEVHRHQRNHGRYILINTNFTPGNPGKFYDAGYLERKNRESIEKWGKPLSEEQREYLSRRVDYFAKLFDLYVKMAEELAKSLDGVKVILRPHPGENHDHYREKLNGVENLDVRFEGNVINWILGAEAVIQTGCTTAIEAWASRKPVVRYNPLKEAVDFESELPNQFGHQASGLHELQDLASRVVSGEVSDTFQDQIPAAKPYIDSIDGVRSTGRILDIIDQSLQAKTGRQTTSRSDIREYYPLSKRLEEARFKLVRYVQTRNGLMKWRHGEEKAIQKAAKYQKFPGLPASTVRTFFKKFAKTDGKPEHRELKIDRVDFDTFIIRNRNKTLP